MAKKTWTEMTETERQEAVRESRWFNGSQHCPVCRVEYGTLEHVARCSRRDPYTGKAR